MDKLTDEQKQVYNQILAWLCAGAQPEAVLDAMAGTGKSFLIKYMYNHVLDDFTNLSNLVSSQIKLERVLVSATTNKAVSSLNELGCSANTIFSTLGAFLRYDPKKKREVPVIANKNKFEYTLIIIDECSMVNWDLMEVIIKKVDLTSCKILYCGDRDQLLPVKTAAKNSPIYTNNQLPTFSLKTLMRNKRYKALQDLAYQLRETVETLSFKDIKTIPGIIDWYTDKDDQIKVLNNFKDKEFDAKVITYTNEKASLYTDYIRDLRNFKEPFCEGESYLSNSFYKVVADKKYYASEVKINTDCPVKILKIKETKPLTDCLILPNEFLTEKEFSNAKDKILNLTNKITVYVCVIQTPKTISQAYVIKDRVEFNKVIKELSKCLDNTNLFVRVNEYILTPTDLKKMFLILDYANACTIHKAQGSTLNTIYIDCSDISSCRNPDTVARLLYVAVTRATDRVVFLNKLNPKYGSFV